MDSSKPSLPIPPHLPEFTQVCVHWIGDAIQPSHPLPPSSPFASIFPSIKVFSNESAIGMPCLILSTYSYFPDGTVVKNLPANAREKVRSLDWEDPREKEMTTHSSFLAWRIPWTEEPGGLQAMELQRVGHNLVTNTHTPTHVTPRKLLLLSC